MTFEGQLLPNHRYIVFIHKTQKPVSEKTPPNVDMLVTDDIFTMVGSVDNKIAISGWQVLVNLLLCNDKRFVKRHLLM